MVERFQRKIKSQGSAGDVDGRVVEFQKHWKLKKACFMLPAIACIHRQRHAHNADGKIHVEKLINKPQTKLDGA